MDHTLPHHARVIAGPDVWLETAAVEQLAHVAASRGCVAAVGMPDLHPGRGIPIGAAFLFDAIVRPALVGGDAGCGVLLVTTRVDGPTGDALERRVRASLDEPMLDPDVLREVEHAALTAGAAGVAALASLPENLAQLIARLGDDGEGTHAPPELGDFASSLGTVGGGNHFAEIVRVDRIHDRARARALGCERDSLAVMVHTGSRALGTALAAKWGESVLEGEAISAYLDDLRAVVRWARVNRALVAYRFLGAIGAARDSRIRGVVDLVHNTVVRREGERFMHRKGAAPAERDQPTIVLGSRGAPSHVLDGTGDEGCLACVAHGAGRRMTRSEAHAKLAAKFTRRSLERSVLGGRVICDDPVLMYEEHPDAYKPIEPVIESLVAAGAATRVASLVPLITVKR